MPEVAERTEFEEIEPLLRIGAKDHFWAFCNFMDYDFFQRRKFLKEPALAINDLLTGKINTLGISFPPRAGKSYLASLAAAYRIGTRPELSIMRNSCSSNLYQKFSYDVRDIVRSDKFQRVFPHVKLSDDKTAVSGWSVTDAKQVTYFGSGTGGTIIGFGASGLAITDDLYKSHEDALSDKVNEKTHTWLQSAHMSRLEKNCPQLDIGTRWHTQDVIGKRLEEGFYDKYIAVPALVDGKSFCEDVKTTEEYLKTKRETDSFIWLSEYQQEPIEAEGLLFPLTNLKRFSKVNEGGIKIAYIDTADEGEDYLSMPISVFFKETNTGYLTDVIFNRESLTANESLISAKIHELDIDYVLVETNKEGSFFLNSLRKLNPNCSITGMFNSTQKLTRILAQAGWITEHFHFLEEYENHPDYNRFMLNLTKYLRTGASKHDDAPDSLAGLASFTRKLLKL